jgi:hypothetical protein
VPGARAQAFQFDNICTLFDQIPQTEGVVSTLSEDWSGSDWDATSRSIYNRSGGQLDNITVQDRSAGSWENATRAVPTYDASDRLDTCLSQTWDTDTNDWSDAARTTRTYDGDGRVERATTEVWDEDAGGWVFVGRSNFTYTAAGHVDVKRDEICLSGCSTPTPGWVNSYQVTNTYDSSDRLGTKVEENWDLVNSQWVEDQTTNYDYSMPSTIVAVRTDAGDDNLGRSTTTLNGDDLPTEIIDDTWAGEWVRDAREEPTYASVGGDTKLVRSVSQTCAGGCTSASPSWSNEFQTLFSYTEVLPVELTSFMVTESGEAAQLVWATASETNNAGFEVQRRLGTEGGFTAIGFVDGAGTTTTLQRYRFTDDALPFDAAQVAYRLRQVDLDGTTAYSPEVELRRGAPARLVLHGNYPNPFQNRTLIRYELPQASLVQMDVFNVLGQRVAQLVDRPQPAGRNEIAFEAHSLPSGVYFVRLEVDGRSQFHQMTAVQ